MGLNIVNPGSNMYQGWITHTWNTIKGECPHGCSYCYMHRWGKQKPVHFDEKELKTDLGSGNFIFVGSSCDMWAIDIPDEWIGKTLSHCDLFNNKYLIQTKNPGRFINYDGHLKQKYVICITLETNRKFLCMGYTPSPHKRIFDFGMLFTQKAITIEPILDFDIDTFIAMIKSVSPVQVNIGADSGNNHLPEPSGDKVLALISELSKFTKVVQKPNLRRLLNNAS